MIISDIKAMMMWFTCVLQLCIVFNGSSWTKFRSCIAVSITIEQDSWLLNSWIVKKNPVLFSFISSCFFLQLCVKWFGTCAMESKQATDSKQYLQKKCATCTSVIVTSIVKFQEESHVMLYFVDKTDLKSTFAPEFGHKCRHLWVRLASHHIACQPIFQLQLPLLLIILGR